MFLRTNMLFPWLARVPGAPRTPRTPGVPSIAPQKASGVDSFTRHSKMTSVLELQAELKRLRAQLKKAEIKAEAYDELINVAEAKFNIPIRKKAGAKQ